MSKSLSISSSLFKSKIGKVSLKRNFIAGRSAISVCCITATFSRLPAHGMKKLWQSTHIAGICIHYVKKSKALRQGYYRDFRVDYAKVFHVRERELMDVNVTGGFAGVQLEGYFIVGPRFRNRQMTPLLLPVEKGCRTS